MGMQICTSRDMRWVWKIISESTLSYRSKLEVLTQERIGSSIITPRLGCQNIAKSLGDPHGEPSLAQHTSRQDGIRRRQRGGNDKGMTPRDADDELDNDGTDEPAENHVGHQQHEEPAPVALHVGARQVETHGKDLDAGDDARQFLSDVILERPPVGPRDVGGEGPQGDSRQGGQGRLRQVEPVPDQLGEEGIYDQEEG